MAENIEDFMLINDCYDILESFKNGALSKKDTLIKLIVIWEKLKKNEG